jgi:Ni/Co efflux regulator RcnB
MTATEKLLWALAALVLFASFMMLSATANPASATDWDWSIEGNSHHAARQKPRKKRTHTRRSYDSSYDRERVRGYRTREYELSTDDEPDWKPVGECAYKIRGLGTQWIGEEGALEAAKKDWMEKVRYDLGESFLDLKNARSFVHRCGRTSIGETMGQVMYRCEMVARPCQGVMNQTVMPVGK